jgi:hypothetical protein
LAISSIVAGAHAVGGGMHVWHEVRQAVRLLAKDRASWPTPLANICVGVLV